MEWVLVILVILVVLLIWKFSAAVRLVGWLLGLGMPGWIVLSIIVVLSLVTLRLLYLQFADDVVTVVAGVTRWLLAILLGVVVLSAIWALAHLGYRPYRSQSESSLTQEAPPFWQRFYWKTRRREGRGDE